ncbi:MAG TPA: hypothetical protein DCZ20_03640 [Lachnospiraceae bacterium]|nr:hypothetical protein [Lachnospiraceae bacterium]
MSRILKITFVIIASLTLTISTGLNVNAATSEKYSYNISNTESSEILRYVATCPYSSNGKHLMGGKGNGFAYYGNTNELRITGTASQCFYCNLILITQNNPFQVPQPVFGNWAIKAVDDPVTTRVIIRTYDFGYSGTHNDSFSMGFEFKHSYKMGFTN